MVSTAARTHALFFLALLLVACDGEPSTPDDAGPPTGDAGPPAPGDDAGPPITADAGPDETVCDADCGRGSCVLEGGVETCACDAGFHAEGLYCRADPCVGDGCPMSVDDWRARFDAEYGSPRRPEEDCDALSRSGGAQQEHYFLAYCVDGLVSVWRATGDDAYLDEALGLIENTVADTVTDAAGRRYWVGPNDGRTHPLWDSYYWRQVSTLLRIMAQHSELLARDGNQARFDDLLAFTRDLWDLWEQDGLGNLYRSRTHMASHWARLGMDLYLLTGEPRYREVFDNISHGVMPGYPSNLRAQMEANPAHPEAWVWSSVWGEPPATTVQDTSHAGAIVSFIHEAALAGQHWTQADVDALSATLMQVVWDPALGGAYHQNVDGTDPTTGAFTGPYGLPGRLGGRLHEWLHLGRRRPDIQARIETEYLDPTRRNVIFFGYEAYGIGALNARVIADGRAYY